MITIQTNKRQRRILILDTVFNLEENQDFPSSMFDAVFIFSDSPDEVKSILHYINPVTSGKCCYKPFLVSKSMQGKLEKYNEIIDHYTNDINDDTTLDVIENILRHNEELKLSDDGYKIISSNLFFIRLFRYLISRGKKEQTPVLLKDSSFGYIVPIFDLFFQFELFTLNEYIAFYHSLLEKKYIRIQHFINKVHLCPKCLHSHLLYIESCPKCHSSSIRSEEVIHHFRCANVSPEHTYNFGGQLRCPKCHHLLRHIGVDYDRPSMVYTCGNCDNNFLHPEMHAICTSCHHSSDVASLTSHDIAAFEITQEGCEAIISPNIGFTIYTDFFDNYLDFDRFANRLRLLMNRTDHFSIYEELAVAKIWVLNNEEATIPLRTDLIAFFCKAFPTHKVSSGNNMIYIKGIKPEEGNDGIESFRLKMTAELKKVRVLLEEGEKIGYFMALPEEDTETFLNNLYYIATVPDKTYEALPTGDRQKGLNTYPLTTNVSLPSVPASETANRTVSQAETQEGIKAIRHKARQKRMERLKISLLALLCVISLVLGTIFIMRTKSKEPQATLPPEKTQPVSLLEEDMEDMSEEDIPITPDNMPEIPQEEFSAETSQTPLIEEMQRNTNYVVWGVFSKKEGALTSHAQWVKEYPSESCRIVYQRNKYFIVLFQSADKEECINYVNSHNYHVGLWIKAN